MGDIVHNNEEVRRLENKGLQIINEDEFNRLNDSRVLIRAHGEPPKTYAVAARNRIELIDATCQVVLKLQRDIAASYLQMKRIGGQIVIYGKKGHAGTDKPGGDCGLLHRRSGSGGFHTAVGAILPDNAECGGIWKNHCGDAAALP